MGAIFSQMALRSFFRQEALEHRARPEPIDGLARVTVPFDWFVLLALAAACAAIVGWCALGEVERTLRADALIVVPDDRRSVVAPAAGRVSEILAAPGDRVDAGRLLARVAIPELELRLAAARERERILLEEWDRAVPEPGLREMLIDARAEVIALTSTVAQASSIASPAAGEVIDHRLSLGAAVAAGEEVARVRVGPPAAPAAAASLPRASATNVQPGAPARLRCGGTRDGEAFDATVAEVSPPPMTPSGIPTAGGLDPGGWQLRVALPDGADVAEGDRCELHIVVDARAPFQLLLAGAGLE
ncbi:MAG: HlyD family efflux transporter periplasmic adaptor subunit [Gammaproteobacteria bacterium]|nr:HlyD family efflux transporter periplasmic adaptor subunit [Gammaproteobacteria bacterium]MDE0362913.1 HlyD family efflux transporter periplasmic adaptor subunit [Rhodospirillaceae bacterium]